MYGIQNRFFKEFNPDAKVVIVAEFSVIVRVLDLILVYSRFVGQMFVNETV
jgi:hypothetical protein